MFLVFFFFRPNTTFFCYFFQSAALWLCAFFFSYVCSVSDTMWALCNLRLAGATVNNTVQSAHFTGSYTSSKLVLVCSRVLKTCVASVRHIRQARLACQKVRRNRGN